MPGIDCLQCCAQQHSSLSLLMKLRWVNKETLENTLRICSQTLDAEGSRETPLGYLTQHALLLRSSPGNNSVLHGGGVPGEVRLTSSPPNTYPSFIGTGHGDRGSFRGAPPPRFLSPTSGSQALFIVGDSLYSIQAGGELLVTLLLQLP